MFLPYDEKALEQYLRDVERDEMDPNANLEEQLRIAERIQTVYDEGRTPSKEDCVRLAELVLALDEWLRKGGFSPRPWTWGQG